MTTHVISLRLPASVYKALQASAANARISVPGALNWLLRNSVDNFELLRGLADCCGPWNSKWDARIPAQTCDQLKLAAEKLGISVSVYTRRLLYHVYVTKRVRYVKSDGHYTLANRDD